AGVAVRCNVDGGGFAGADEDLRAEDDSQRRRETFRLSGTKTPTYGNVLEPGIVEDEFSVVVVVVETGDRLAQRVVCEPQPAVLPGLLVGNRLRRQRSLAGNPAGAGAGSFPADQYRLPRVLHPFREAAAATGNANGALRDQQVYGQLPVLAHREFGLRGPHD